MAGGASARGVTRRMIQIAATCDVEECASGPEAIELLHTGTTTVLDHIRFSPAADPEAGSRTLVNLDILLHFVSGEKQDLGLLQGLEKAQCPVLVMAGEEDPVTPPEDAEEIVAALPAPWVSFERFPGVGHGAWRDDADAAERVLRRFLA